MTKIPTGTELVRPFLPTKDFDLSKRLLRETLGFTKILNGDVSHFDEVGVRAGSSCSAITGRSGPRTA